MPPSLSAFISYSRRNGYLAAQLWRDLRRAGIGVWMDASGIALESQWRDEIRSAIEGCDVVLLLASPEAASSLEVGREVEHATALGKRIVRLLITQPERLPQGWLKFHMADFRTSYAQGLGKLVAHLLASPSVGLVSMLDLIRNESHTVAEACGLVEGTELRIAGRSYCELPIEASGYTRLSLIAPAEERLALPAEIAAILKFTGSAARANSFEEVVRYLASNCLPVWVVLVRGPCNVTGDFDLPQDAPHIWSDALSSAVHTLQLPVIQGRPLHLFLETPLALAYAVGSQMRNTQPCYLYQLERYGSGESRYRQVLG